MIDPVHKEQIAKACQLLSRGELVAFPTETVYGLGADASNPQALKRLYAAKGRPSDHPVIVHLHSIEQVGAWAKDVPDCLELLARRFWPGPLTVVLRRAAPVLDQVTGGQDTVAVRVPAHPLALALLKEYGAGLAAPSANKFGRLSPTRACDVSREFGCELSMVLDGGPCQVGIESTILDLSCDNPRILRPGMIFASAIESAAAITLRPLKERDSAGVRVPGALSSHYAPRTRLMLLSGEQLQASVSDLLDEGKMPAVLAFSACPPRFGCTPFPWLIAPLEPERYAHELYHSLRNLDTVGADCILVEDVPQEPHWSGIRDRLRRAAADAG